MDEPIWYRIFGISDLIPLPVHLVQHLVRSGFAATKCSDDHVEQWFQLAVSSDGLPILHIERFTKDEEDIRNELNTWAAWIESTGEGEVQNRLMQHMISTSQIFTLRFDSAHGKDQRTREVATNLCRFLSHASNGVYQIDGQGFYNMEGSLLLPE